MVNIPEDERVKILDTVPPYHIAQPGLVLVASYACGQFLISDSNIIPKECLDCGSPYTQITITQSFHDAIEEQGHEAANDAQLPEELIALIDAMNKKKGGG